MIDPLWLLTGLALPLAIAFAGGWASLRQAREQGADGQPGPRGWRVALGVSGCFAIALIVAGIATNGNPFAAPIEAADKLVLLVLPAGLVIAIADSFSHGRRWLGAIAWLGRAATAAALLPIVLSGSAYLTDLNGPFSLWSRADAWVYLSLSGVLTLIVWMGVRQVAGRLPGWIGLAVMSGAMLAGGGATVASGSVTLGQLGMAFAAAGLGLLVAVALGRGSAAGAAWADVAVPAFVGMLATGRFFAATMTNEVALLLLAAPLTPLVLLVRPLRLPKPWQRGGVGIGAAAAVAAIAVALAGVQGLESSDDGADDAGGYDYSSLN